MRQYSGFLLLALALFCFYATQYRSIIVQFDVATNGFGTLQMEYASKNQAFSVHNHRLIKIAPSAGHPVRLEISSRAAIERLRWTVVQGNTEASLSHVRILAPRTGKSEANPSVLFANPSITALSSSAPPPEAFRLTTTNSLEASVPRHLYAQPAYQWLELATLLAIYTLFALVIDGRRLRAPGTDSAARWPEYLLALTCLVLAAMGTHQITYSSIVGDAEENLAIAFNLLHHGVYSHMNTEVPIPGNLREPVPTFFYAAWLVLIEQFDHVINLNHLWGGAGTYAVKLGNFFWIYAGLVAFSKLIFRLIPSIGVGLMGLLLVFITFFGNAQWVDTLYTELHTAVLLLWLAHFALAAVRQPSRKHLIGVGIFTGLLILTKAIFLYVFLVLAVAWLVVWARARQATGWQNRGWEALTVAAVALCVIAPWSVRNAVQFGSPSISSVRGGGVMSYRAMLDDMKWAEIKGMLYLNGPPSYRYLSDHLTGAPQRNDYQRGGRWARLYIGPSDFQTTDKLARHQGRPEDAVSFHQKSSAEFVKRIEEAKAQGSTYPERDADQAMGRDAVRYFIQHPARHIAMSLPFFWAGFWGFGSGFFSGAWGAPWDRVVSTVFEAINLAAGLSLLAVFGLGLTRSNRTYLAISAPACLMMGAYTAISQNLPRFFAPAHPLMILCLMLLLFSRAKAKPSDPPD